jgi:hypothetical protein
VNAAKIGLPEALAAAWACSKSVSQGDGVVAVVVAAAVVAAAVVAAGVAASGVAAAGVAEAGASPAGVGAAAGAGAGACGGGAPAGDCATAGRHTKSDRIGIIVGPARGAP